MSELPNNLDKLKSEAPPLPKAEVIEAPVEVPSPKNEGTKEAPAFVETLSPENKGFFSKLGEGAKQLASWTYEKTLGKAVGKAKILYHEYWMSKHQGKSEVLKGKILETKSKIAQAEKSHAEISNAVKELAALNTPNMKSFEEKLRAIEGGKRKLEGDQAGLEKKLQYRDEKVNMRTERRDAVVDGFIGKVNERLNPVEQNLEAIKDKKAKFEAKVSMSEIVWKKKLEDCQKQKEIKARLEKALRDSGMTTEYSVNEDEGLSKLQLEIDEGEKQIKEAREKVEKQRSDMDKKLQKIQRKADGFKNKRDEFQKMKEGRHEEVEVEAEVNNSDWESPQENTGGNEADVESKVEAGKEEFSVKTYINLFNNYLGEKFGSNSQPEVVDIKKFKEMTEGIKELAEDSYVTFDQFKDIVGKYLDATGVKSERLKFLLSDFYAEKVKEPVVEKEPDEESEEDDETQEEPEVEEAPRFEKPAEEKPVEVKPAAAETAPPKGPEPEKKPEEEPVKIKMQNNGKGDLGKFSAN